MRAAELRRSVTAARCEMESAPALAVADSGVELIGSPPESDLCFPFSESRLEAGSMTPLSSTGQAGRSLAQAVAVHTEGKHLRHRKGTRSSIQAR